MFTQIGRFWKRFIGRTSGRQMTPVVRQISR